MTITIAELLDVIQRKDVGDNTRVREILGHRVANLLEDEKIETIQDLIHFMPKDLKKIHGITPFRLYQIESRLALFSFELEPNSMRADGKGGRAKTYVEGKGWEFT